MESIDILLVDDRPANLLALEATLKRTGYNLIQVTSGEDALRELLSRNFALIILDAQMPKMDGFETARLIRLRERSKFTPIIFLTAIYTDERFIQLGYESGAVDYVTKPFNPDILRSKVAIFVEMHRQKLQLQEQAEVILRERHERMRAEALKEHFNAIVDGLDHSIIWEIEPSEMRLLFVSRRAEQLLGYSHEHWFSEEAFFLNHVPEKDRELVRSMLDKVLSTGADQRCEHRLIADDGTELWFHTGVQYERKGHFHQATIQGLSVDITSLKRSEEEFKSRARKYRRVVDANMLGHFFSNMVTGEVTEANDCFLEMVGYSREELVGGKVRWTEMTPPEYASLDEMGIRELKETGVCNPFEKEYVRKDGARIPVLIGAAKVEDDSEECVCFALDLSEQKRAEKEKLRAVRAREEMLEIVAHDLKNPLSAILLNAVLLLRTLPAKEDQSYIRRQVEGIERSAGRMKRLIEDLLDLAKVEAGRLMLEKRSCDPRSLVQESIEMLKDSAKEKRIKIQTNFSVPLSGVDCDTDRMLQVFSNIIGNAVKFTPEGGTIGIAVSEKGDGVHFRITDTGPGMDRDSFVHIFDRYWQSRNTAKQGTGLGLAIAKGIVEAHGGTIEVDSELGKGSTFEVILPLNDSVI